MDKQQLEVSDSYKESLGLLPVPPHFCSSFVSSYYTFSAASYSSTSLHLSTYICFLLCIVIYEDIIMYNRLYSFNFTIIANAELEVICNEFSLF
jgi:hypothetical protein